jgi:hypothetical protein
VQLVGEAGFEDAASVDVDEVSRPYEADEAPNAADGDRKPGVEVGNGPTLGHYDDVENALAKALGEAAAAGRFDVVAQLARELEARRLARSTTVVSFVRPARTK